MSQRSDSLDNLEFFLRQKCAQDRRKLEFFLRQNFAQDHGYTNGEFELAWVMMKLGFPGEFPGEWKDLLEDSREQLLNGGVNE